MWCVFYCRVRAMAKAFNGYAFLVLAIMFLSMRPTEQLLAPGKRRAKRSGPCIRMQVGSLANPRCAKEPFEKAVSRGATRGKELVP